MAAKGRMPVGRAPYGYGYDKMTKTRYVIEEQANIVRRVFLMRASGMQFRTIAGTLNKEGIRTANGAVFRTNTIKRMVEEDFVYRSGLLRADGGGPHAWREDENGASCA